MGAARTYRRGMSARARPQARPGRPRGEDSLVDLVVAVLLAGIGLTSLLGAATGERPADALALALVLAGAGSLLLLRAHPVPVLAVTLGTAVAIDQLGYPQNGLGLTVLWALYVVGLDLPVRRSLPLTLGTLVLVNLSAATAPGHSSLADHLSTTVILGAGWTFGRAVHARRSRRAAEERAAVAEERTRVAREMQDLVVHELAEMTVQVTAARRMAAVDPRTTDELLAGAESSARAAVAEVRRILALLTPVEEAREDRRPLPGLGDLVRLAQRHTARGLPVALTMARADEVAAGPGLLAYRAVELALEEAWRSCAGRADVAVDVGPGGLQVVVRHERMAGGEVPAGATDAAAMSGLVRRAQLYGGTVDRQVGAAGGTVVLEIPSAGTRRAG